MDCLGSFSTLKQHKEFQYIYKKGTNQHSSSVVLFFLPQNNIKKVGFTATAKKIGNAVNRNRAKRRLRALFVENSKNLKDGTYIFVAKQTLVEAPHIKLEKDFLHVLKRSKSFKETSDD